MASGKDNPNYRHGHSIVGAESPTYTSWRGMLDRVKNNKFYEKLDFYPPWYSFSSFLEDMGERPQGKSIDRTDNTKGYHPDNCRWATRLEQNSNTRQNNKFIGVSLNERGRWYACRKVKGKTKNLGTYVTHLAACYARWAFDAHLVQEV